MALKPRTTASPESSLGDNRSIAETRFRNHACPFNLSTCPGCMPPEQLPVHDEGLRLQHKIIFWQAMADVSGLKSPQLERAQLEESFVNSYWSMGVMSSSKAYLHVFQWLAPHGDALNASRDALCLIHLGVRYQDERLLLEGRKRHLAALRLLGAAVSKPNAAFDDTILGASYTLGHCEVYKVISHNGKGWRGHTEPFQQILKARGPKSMVTPFAHALLHNIRQVEISQAFLTRKASYLSTPEWISAAEEKYPDSTSSRATNMALQVGRALERADCLCALRKPLETQIVRLLDEMMRLELGLKDWLNEAYRCSDDFIPLGVVVTSTFTSFHGRCGGLSGIFPRSIEFATFMSATSHVYNWTCLLLLRQAIADVARLNPYPLLSSFSKSQNAMLIDSIDECAMSLCQSLAFLSQGNHGFAGVMSCGAPLYFASEWYRKKQDTSKLLWTTHVREFLQRDVLLGGSFNTSLDLQKPVFTWWMLPDIFSNFGDKRESKEDDAGYCIDEISEEQG